ncbi:hypothetical protein GCM10026982_25740 [Nocardiopsis aegyptia]
MRAWDGLWGRSGPGPAGVRRGCPARGFDPFRPEPERSAVRPSDRRAGPVARHSAATARLRSLTAPKAYPTPAQTMANNAP